MYEYTTKMVGKYLILLEFCVDIHMMHGPAGGPLWNIQSLSEVSTLNDMKCKTAKTQKRPGPVIIE